MLIREWLRLLAEQNVDLLAIEKELINRRVSLKSVLDGTKNFFIKSSNTLQAKQGVYDFSHEVKLSMSACLACKACSTQCPIKIDVPAFRSRFLQLYHTRYLRPARDYIVANVESYAPLMAKAPRFFNFFIGMSLTGTLSEKSIGMTNLPLLSSPNLKQYLQGHQAVQTTLEQLESMPEERRKDYVLIVQDPFTSYYDAKVVADFVVLVEKLGFRPVLLPFKPNGKAQHIKGFLRKFTATAQKNSDFLNRVALLNLPIVGVDPALVLCYRDEYKETLAEKRGDFNVLLAHEWLKKNIEKLPQKTTVDKRFFLFGHCTESTTLPGSGKDWKTIFSRFGAELNEVNVGCCGMAGTYGHEVDNLKLSEAIYNLSWQPALTTKDIDYCLTTGYSCRSQVKRFEGQQMRHPLQALLSLI